MASRKLFTTKTILFRTKSAMRFSLASFKCDKVFATKSEVYPSWNRAVEDAIEIVRYESPFSKLSYITTDNNVNWSKNIEKLSKTDHPMHETTKSLFTKDGTYVNQIFGIVVLLVSKLAGHPYNDLWTENDFDEDTLILKRQKSLAYSIEYTSSSTEIHRKGVLNMQDSNMAGMTLDNDDLLIFGNKISILAGDMLAGTAILEIVKFGEHTSSILASTAVRDIVDSNFIGERDNQNNPLPSDPFKKFEEQKKNPKIFEEVSTDQIDNTLPFKLHDIMGSAESEWRLRHTLGGGTLLGKMCQGALDMAKHNEEKQKEIYFMGKHMYLSYRAAKDLNIFRSNEVPSSGKFSLISAPLLFHLEEDPSLYEEIKKGTESIENINFAKIHEAVRNGPGMEKTKELLRKNNLVAYTLLHKFPNSDARNSIENLILALEGIAHK